MSIAPPPWLSSAPWLIAPSQDVCRQAHIAVGDVPIVELPSRPCSAAELLALRCGRYVPLFAKADLAQEAARAESLARQTFSLDADPRATDHALTLLLHPVLGVEPFRRLSMAVTDGMAPRWSANLVLGLVGALGTNDETRGLVAHALERAPALSLEAMLFTAGGGDRSTWREHYHALREADAAHPAPRSITVLRHWYDLVLARRWSGIDGLRALASDGTLDGASRWLAATGPWIIGDEHARDLLTDLAQVLLEPVGAQLPRLAQIVAREMVELLSHPWSTRWAHLRCAAARDHASASIRQWLHAAAEERFFEGPATDPAMTAGELGELGPETSRAAAAATEARGVGGDFLLDWFVSDREARSAVDEWARATLRLYHRLRGAVLLDGALRVAHGGVP